MSSPPNITFGYLQMEERYKNLERTIKKMQLKELEKDHTNNESRSGASSINGNLLDNTIGETNSRIGSEVVSSSTNMRNIISKNLKSHGSITTSSFKNSPDTVEDRVIMPPPKTMGILAHSSRRNSLASPHIPTKINPAGTESNASIISSINYPTPSDFSKKTCGILHSTLDLNKPDRIFKQWKVVLNDKRELLIKGKLDCGRSVRSKPVVQRIDATTVRSVFSNIYCLQGRIHDEENELPEYVRGKFYNGFPDDWENVYNIWQSFVEGGCDINFRWPTPITDSDDDLISEITEVYSPSKSLRRLRPRKRPPRSIEKTKDSSKKSFVTKSPVNPKHLSPEHQPGESLLPAAPRSAPKQLIKSPRSGSRATNNNREAEKVSEEVTVDSSDESRNVIDMFLGKMSHYLLNSSNAQFTPSAEESSDIAKAFSIMLKNKKHSVEYLDGIVKMSNSLKNTIIRAGVDDPLAESNQLSSVPPRSGNSSRNFGTTYTMTDANKSLSAASNKILKERNGGQAPSNFYAKDNLKRAPVCRKLTHRDYDSSDEYDRGSDDDDDNDERYDSRRVLKPRSLRVSRKRLHDRQKILKSVGRRRPYNHDDSDSDDNFPHKSKKAFNGPAYDDRRTNIDAVEPEQEKLTRRNSKNIDNRRIPTQQPPIVVRESRPVLQPPGYPAYLHDRRGAESASTITGFLANYDSCTSFTEDERRAQGINRQKLQLDHNRHGKVLQPVVSKNSAQYDSCVSVTEDESNKITTEATNRNKFKKPVLQETNAQYFGEILKRTTLQQLKQVDKNDDYQHQHPKTSPSLLKNVQNPPEFSQTVSTKMAITDDKENEENGSRQTLRAASPQIIKREERQESSNKIIPEFKKPSVVSIENVSMKLHPRSMKSPPCLQVKSPKKNVDKSVDKQLTDDKLMKKSYRLTDENVREKVSVPVPALKTPEAIQSEALARGKNLSEKYPRDTRCEKLQGNQSRIKFGSEDNPKVLTCWMPNIKKMANTKYGLIFEGKLLNEAGHVTSKKYKTDVIVRRVTPRIVETINNEFYELSGDLVNAKYVVPRELQKLCMDGCPAKISAFCEKWRKIKNDESSLFQSAESLNASIDMSSVPTSSRGRRRVQTLRYWEGERLSMKGDDVYYSPGHLQDSILPSSNETSRKDTSQNSSRKRNTSKDNSLAVKKNSSDPKNKSSSPSPRKEIIKTKQLKDNSNYNLNAQKESGSKTAVSPRVSSDNRRRSQRFRSAKRKSSRDPKSPCSDSSNPGEDPGNSRSKRRRRVVNYCELKPDRVNKRATRSSDSKNKRGSKNKSKHDSDEMSSSDETPPGVSYCYRTVPYRDKFFSDE
ncbi:uncharacterized protein LOC130667913 [Microplitis mediator]|uniref:uncharacterized protein LOC130667913 n=1 Tax=Microplitis mediator TaxID=375433 RepID=UPI002555A9E3|nr:uncharacterized protein LOC130667913 [Microplitis mediator]